MSFRRLFGPNQSRFLVLTGRRPLSTSTTANATETPLQSTTVRGRRLKGAKELSPIAQMRRDFRTFLDSCLSASTESAPSVEPREETMTAQFTTIKMKEMLKRAVEVGDVELFSAMLDAVPDTLLAEIDNDHSLRSFAMVKLTEVPVSKAAAEAMFKVLHRCTTFDPFLCELLMNRVLEESDVVVLDQTMSLLKDRQWSFPIDQQMSEQLITDVYLPNCRFDDIKTRFKETTFSSDCYTLVLLALVNPDPTKPTVPQYSTLPPFMADIKKCDNLAAALEHLFSVHPPPDHILTKLLVV